MSCTVFLNACHNSGAIYVLSLKVQFMLWSVDIRDKSRCKPWHCAKYLKLFQNTMTTIGGHVQFDDDDVGNSLGCNYNYDPRSSKGGQDWPLCHKSPHLCHIMSRSIFANFGGVGWSLSTQRRGPRLW